MRVLNPKTSTEEDIFGALRQGDLATIVVRDIEEFSFVNQSSFVDFIAASGKRFGAQLIVTAGHELVELRRQGKLLGTLGKELAEFELARIPSLSERVDDIPLLVEHFARNACSALGLRFKAVDTNTIEFLTRREWKENLRELKGVIEKSVLASQGAEMELPQELLDEFNQVKGLVESLAAKRPVSIDRTLHNLEKTIIERALAMAGHNQSKAAKLLDISEANFRYRLKKFGIATVREQ